MRGERGARCLELLSAHHPEVKVVVVSPQRHTTTSAGHSPAARGRTSSRASTRLISPQRCHARTTKPCIRRSVSSPGRSTSCAGRTSKRARPRRAPAARWGRPRSARAHDERPYIALSVAGAMLCRCRMEEFEQRAGRGRCAQFRRKWRSAPRRCRGRRSGANASAVPHPAWFLMRALARATRPWRD